MKIAMAFFKMRFSSSCLLYTSIKPFEVRSRLAEKFQLQLFKLPRPERKIPGRDFITEGLPALRDAKRHLFPARPLYVFKIDENSLRRFRPQITLRLRVLRNALEGFEHHVEFPDLRPFRAAADGTGNFVFRDV